MFWNDDAMNACRFCCAKQGAEVVDILNRVKDHQERRLVFAGGVGEYIVDGGIGALGNLSHATLMNGSLAELVETVARHHLNRDMALFGFLYHCFNGGSLAYPLRQENALDPPGRV